MIQTHPQYRCSDCKLKHKGDKLEKQKAAMACNYIADKPRHEYRPDHNNKGNPRIKYSKCVGNYFNGYWGSFINNFPSYEKGIMPYSGGLFEQPAKFVEAMNLVHNLINENSSEKERKQKLATQGRNIGRRSSKR